MVSPVTAKMTNFDNEDDLDVFYDAINSDEEEEFYDSLEHFEQEESGKSQISYRNIDPIEAQKNNSGTILAEKRSFGSIIEEDKAVVGESLSVDSENKRLQKKLKVAPKSAKPDYLSFAAMAEFINSGSNKTSSSQDNASKNDDKKNKAPIPPPVFKATASIVPVSIAPVSMAPVPIVSAPIVSVSSEKRKLEHAEHEEPTSSNSLESSKLQVTSPSGVPKNEKPLKKIKVASKSRSSFIDDLRAAINKNAPTTWPCTLRYVAAFHSELKLTMPPIIEKHAFCGFQNEATICQANAQLSVSDKRQRWKKRGSGTVVLDKEDDQARLVMLDDTTFRPIFGLKLFFGMKVRVTDSNCIKIDAFNTVYDIYGRPGAKLVRYSLRFDCPHNANVICGYVNSQAPSSPAVIPKKVLHDTINKDVYSIISSLMSAKNPWKL